VWYLRAALPRWTTLAEEQWVRRVKPKVIIYCDGACSPNPGIGGWAALLISSKHGKEKVFTGAEADTTNNRMELTAAMKGLEALKIPCEVDIHTDSQYVHHAFTEGWLTKWASNGWKNSERKPVVNSDLWRKLMDLSRTHEIHWYWIRGHSDSVENARVDALAVRARERLAAQLRR